MSWLITGGCGFIGTQLIKKLIDRGERKIRIIDNLCVGTLDDLKCVANFKELDKEQIFREVQGIEFCNCDIKDYKMVDLLCKGVDNIIHLAASTGVGLSVVDPINDFNNNVLGTMNVLESARKNNIRRFVFASSGAPLGEVEPPIHENLAPRPVSPYGASKLAGEGYCSAYCKSFGLETVILRFSNVYGPGSLHKQSVVAKFIKNAILGGSLEIYGDGRQTRDFIYIEDLLEAILLAATVNNISGETFQIATNKETSLIELVEILSQIFQTRCLNKIQIDYSEDRNGDVRRSYSITDKASKILNWQAVTSLENGLVSTIDYFLAEMINA